MRKNHKLWPSYNKSYYRIKTKGGVDKNYYSRVHQWLIRTYGSANTCEWIECDYNGCNFEWALKKNLEYDFKRDNFMQLCVPHHRKYDYNPDVAERIGRSLSKNYGIKKEINAKYKRSETTRKKIGASQSVAIDQYTFDGKFIKTHPSIISAATAMGFRGHTAIWNNLVGKSKTSAGFIWKYAKLLNKESEHESNK